jgi:alpha-glucosidase (family GH31 glycosyl hydrolase)
MDWHVKPQWGSYSWDKRLFSNPTDAIQNYLKDTENLITLANIHDDNGVVNNETQHAAMVKMMHLPSDTKDIPFAICNNQEYALALEDAVLLPVELNGIDYWWIDWQQGGNHGGCKGLLQNPTIWTNKIRSTDHIRRAAATAATTSKRGLVLARWGGLGSHRYQVGFSGDVSGVNWKSLAYQPYFSMTSTNVAYGFWSHDIVGPGGADMDSLELYTRWLQWATYSGIFRSHDRGSSGGSCAGKYPPTLTSNTCTIVKPWNVPLNFFKANRVALQRRAALIP